MDEQPARTTLEATRRRVPPDPIIGPADADEVAGVTVYLRPRAADRPRGRVSRDELATTAGAADADVAALRAFAAEHGLAVAHVDQARRSVGLSGRVADLATAFGTELHLHRNASGTTYRGRDGALTLPADLAPSVSGVFGLDTRPQATTQFRIASEAAVSYNPTEVAAAYNAPPGTGAGQCVGLIELGGGYRADDLATYFASLGLATPTVTAVSVDGGTNTPGSSDGPDGEVMLDIEMVGCIANGAAIAVYFAPNTDQGFIDAVTTAINDTTNKPSIVSISWGGAESTWTAQAMQQMEAAFTDAATLGVTILVAAGDNGSTDSVTDGSQHVDFPASAPHALGCGGTSL
jgi:kumamolisin